MRIKFMTKKTISQVLSVVLLCALCFGAVFGISALSNKLKEETKVIHPVFEVGGINAQGKGDKDMDGAIYTKEAFLCDGLEIKLDFDAAITYRVCFYNKRDVYISSTEVFDQSKRISVPFNATYARIVITPIWADELDTADRVCHWYDVAKYSSQLEIRVNKDQNIDSLNLYKHDPANEGKSIAVGVDGLTYIATDNVTQNHCYASINVEAMEKVEILYKNGTESSDFEYIILDKDSKVIECSNTPSGESSVMIELPEEAFTLIINYNFKIQEIAVYER